MGQRIITEKLIKGFWEYLKREEKSEATLDKYTRDLRAFSLYAAERDITKELVITYIKWDMRTEKSRLH